MTMLQFDSVSCDKVDSISFSISAGECKILKVASSEAKSAVIELALGELLPLTGVVLLQGQAVEANSLGSVAWVPASGGLISNLKVWENITLPLWFHHTRERAKTEEDVTKWLAELKPDDLEIEKFMASPAARLKKNERKLAGLLRGLIQSPNLLLIDAALFDELDEIRKQIWIKALEKFVLDKIDRAVLVVSRGNTSLPLDKIELR